MSEQTDRIIDEMEKTNANFQETIDVIQGEADQNVQEISQHFDNKVCLEKPKTEYDHSKIYDPKTRFQEQQPKQTPDFELQYEEYMKDQNIDYTSNLRPEKISYVHYEDKGTLPSEIVAKEQKKAHPQEIIKAKAKQGFINLYAEMREAFKSRSKTKQ
jgi:hypothetical protein